MKLSFQCVGQFTLGLMLTGCASSKIIRDDPPGAWHRSPATRTHASHGGSHSTVSSEATGKSNTPTNSYYVATPSRDTVETIQSTIVQVEKAQGTAKLEASDLFSWYDRFKIAVYQALIAPAHANKKSSVDKTWTDDDFRKLAAQDKNALMYFENLKELQFSHDGSPTPQSISMQLTLKQGRTLQGTVDRNWQRSCQFFDQATPPTSKSTYNVSNLQSNKTEKSRHPFEGKACSEAALKNYSFFNFDLGDSGQGIPSAVLILAKDKKLGINHIFYREESGLKGSLKESLEESFKEVLQKTAFAK